MKFAVFDTETDGFAYAATKIHILSYTYDGKEVTHTKDPEEIREFFSQSDTLFVAHNSICFDMVVLNRILDIPLDYTKFVDTMALCWYLMPNRPKIGLATFQEFSGVEKPHIKDWNSLSWEDAKLRCGNDVLINHWLWVRLEARLTEIYGGTEEYLPFLKYISFKMDCLREQEEFPLYVDVQKAKGHWEKLEALIEEKVEALVKAMPKKPIMKTYNKPKITHKNDGSLSAHMLTWIERLHEHGFDRNTEGPISVIDKYIDGNPKSPEQVKDWLFSLGWKPCTYKYERDKVTGDERTIPQIRYFSNSDPRKGQLTESVLKLKDKEPAIEILEGLTVAQHRSAIFKGFMFNSVETDREGINRMVSGAGGFTNTLRLKHRAPVVNLPGVEAVWGKEIRGCIVAGAGEVLCGSDVSSLESCTKRHYMYPHDPDYVNEMSEPGFDEHVNLSVYAGEMTEDEEEFYKWYQQKS